MGKQQEFEEAKRVVLNGNAYCATSALESLNKRNKMPDIDFLEKAYMRRRRCIDRIEIVEMLGKKQTKPAREMLRQIVQNSSVTLVRYYALRNLIENGVSMKEFRPSRAYSSFWASLGSYEEYRQHKISLEELRIRAKPFAGQNDYNWYWLAHN